MTNATPGIVLLTAINKKNKTMKKITRIMALAVLSVTMGQAAFAQQPNILWVVCEDISPTIGCYGDAVAKTPVIDKLAQEGIRFTNAFAAAGVCAPSRSGIITGMYPVGIGTEHMRTAGDVSGVSKGIYKSAEKTGIIDLEGNTVPQYSAVIPEQVKCFTEFLRKAGYYCTNNAKTDYQFAPPITAWDENSLEAHWKGRPEGKPFFSVFNFNVSHESQIWKKKNDPLLIDIDAPKILPYFPENPIVRQDVARNYSNIAEMDSQIGELLAQLEEDGLLENTIIFFYSDHGGPLPRGKREIYDSGLKVPLVVRFPDKSKAGTTFDELVQYVDLAPTVLSLAGIKPPKYLDGQAFMGEYAAKNPRKYIYAGRGRLDFETDMVRCVRDKEFLYVKNYHPELPNYMDIKYRKQMPMMNELLRLHEAGELNAEQEIWFHKTKPDEELYFVSEDPHQLNNIASDPKYAKDLGRMRKELKKWQNEVGDKGFIPEGEMVRQMWPNLVQPKTQAPVIQFKKGKAVVSCSEKGASIAYQITGEGQEAKDDLKYWKVYDNPVEVQKGEELHVVAIRIGYKQSDEVRSL